MATEEKAAKNNAMRMEEDSEYQRQLSLFVRSSTEKGIELVKIGEVIAGLNKRRSFLDIGAGGGDLTIPIAQSFQKTTIVEPNQQQTDNLKRRCPSFRIINDFWETIDLGEERFDFILCSHVLYYIREGKWLNTIEKMYAHLEDNGCIALVIQSPIGEVAELFQHFTDYDVNILTLWSELIQRYGDRAITVKYFINEIFAADLEDMTSIGLFLLLDPSFRQRKKEISEYLETRHRLPEGYRIKQDEILLVIKKKADKRRAELTTRAK